MLFKTQFKISKSSLSIKMERKIDLKLASKMLITSLNNFQKNYTENK